jgi:hypothetical protein
VLVRTRGGDGRSWLLIKHRDDWAGPIDIAEFAPRSVKSDGDFEDILAADTPAVWRSNRPARGGQSGAMLAGIIEKAAALQAGRRGKPRDKLKTEHSKLKTKTKTKSDTKTRTTNKTAGVKARTKLARKQNLR